MVSPWNGASGGCGQRKTVIWRVHSWLVRIISEEEVVSCCCRSSCLACPPCPLIFFPRALLLERDSLLCGLLKCLPRASPVLLPNPWIWPLLLSSQLQYHQVKGVRPYDGPVASPVLWGFHWGPMTLLWAVPLPLLQGSNTGVVRGWGLFDVLGHPTMELHLAPWNSFVCLLLPCQPCVHCTGTSSKDSVVGSFFPPECVIQD